MPIDRAATLKTAEKLLRQGKLDGAIAEYAKIVAEQPGDWNTANTLGDLYARAGQTDKSVEQFIRIADHLNEEGFLPKAAAIYKKVLKLKPDHEHALIQAGEIASSQGLLADARNHYAAVIERRKARNDTRGAAQIRLRLGTLDPNDYEGRMMAASARIELNDVAGAVRDMKEIAAELVEKDRRKDALTALNEASRLAPDDEELSARLFELHIAEDSLEDARRYATTAVQLKALAETLDQRKRFDDALDMLRDAARLDPSDIDLRVHLARAFVAKGDTDSASEYLTVEIAGDDPELLLTVIEIRVRSGKIDEVLDVARRLLEQDPERREQIAAIGWNIAEQAPEAGYRLVELAADLSVAQSNWPSAAASLQEFVTRVPNHIPALLRLVEICVDGGLETTMNSAQAQLADAYITAGAAAEARVIAEDLVAREPWERANIERFRTTLVLMNEPDPDAVIAERLSGQSPFTSTDLFDEDLVSLPVKEKKVEAEASAEAPVVEAAPADAPAAAREAPAAEAPAQAKPAEAKPAAARKKPQFELSANAVDINSILADLDAAPAPAPRAPKARAAADEEVDLSTDLDVMKKLRPPPPPPQKGGDDPVPQPRDEASRRSATEAAELEYRRGLELRQSGDTDGCIAALQSASKAPKLRFVTASLLGRIYQERDDAPRAIEWLERAAQAPAPTPGEYHQVLYELAGGLETVGEVARALAVCLELQADAGPFRDVAERVERLAKAQTRG